MFYGVLWFVLISVLGILIWRFRVADKREREERERRNRRS